MFNFIPSWVPTKQDQLQYREDELKYLKEELPRIAKEFSSESEKLYTIEKEFIKSLNENQQRMYLDMKATSQKVQFSYSRMTYNQKRENEIPEEIKEIIN
jgi:hypothetical protein